MIFEYIDSRGKGKVPLWFMRQAGRYMASYRKLKEKYSFLEMCKTPELAAEITLLPISQFGYDVAILFSDILIPLEPMGMKLDYCPAPMIENPIQTIEDFERLKIPEVCDYEFICETISLINAELPKNVELIGFSAAPFTLLCYMVEGRSGSDFEKIKRVVESDELSRMVDFITEVIKNYASAQIEAGVRVFQLFDTWASLLKEKTFERYFLNSIESIIRHIQSLGGKVIYFWKNGEHLILPIGKLSCDVLSVDGSRKLDEYSEIFDGKYVLQGNLRPEILMEDREEIKREIDEVMKSGKKCGKHIMNLAHGILKDTPEDNVKFAVDYIHEWIELNY